MCIKLKDFNQVCNILNVLLRAFQEIDTILHSHSLLKVDNSWDKLLSKILYFFLFFFAYDNEFLIFALDKHIFNMVITLIKICFQMLEKLPNIFS